MILLLMLFAAGAAWFGLVPDRAASPHAVAASPVAAGGAPAVPVTEPPLAPTPVLGMGDEELKDASVTLAERFNTAAYDALQQGEVSQYPAAWKQAAAYLEAAAALNDPSQG